MYLSKSPNPLMGSEDFLNRQSLGKVAEASRPEISGDFDGKVPLFRTVSAPVESKEDWEFIVSPSEDFGEHDPFLVLQANVIKPSISI